jgi:hypothetical protein
LSRHGVIRPLLAAVGLTLLALGMLPSQAVSPASGLQAALRAGACAHPGSLTATLQAPIVPNGPRQGAPAAIPGATSFTPAPMPLAALLATPHVIMIAEADTVVACGALGGVLAPDGSLTVVLRSAQGSAVCGLAFIAASGSISLFVDPGASDGATPLPLGVASLPTVAPTPIG